MQANVETLLNAMLQGIATMGRGRKKREVHPGQPCGPCHLCQHSSTHYCHIATWDEELKAEIRQITAVSDRHCICRACEGDFKCNAGRDGHRFRWMVGVKTGPGSSRCIIASCTENDTIIHTGIATKDRIADLLGDQVLSEPKHLLTPLCVRHYRHVHRLLHDNMYTDKRCCTCHALIHGIARHCPNPTAVKEYFMGIRT